MKLMAKFVVARAVLLGLLVLSVNQTFAQAPAREAAPKVSRIYIEAVQRAESAYLAKDYDAAKELFSELVSKDATLSLGWFRLGLIAQHQSQFEDSLGAYAKVIQLAQSQQNNPEFSELASKALFNRGHVFMAMARNDFAAPLEQLDEGLKAASIKFAKAIRQVQTGETDTEPKVEKKIESKVDSVALACAPQVATAAYQTPVNVAPINSVPDIQMAEAKPSKKNKLSAVKRVVEKTEPPKSDVQVFSGGGVKP